MKWELRVNKAAQFSSIPLFLLLWQWVSDAEIVNPLLFPPPTRVAEAFLRWAQDGPLLMDVAMSVSRVLVGFVAGAVIGIFIGLLTGRYRLIASFLTPVFGILRPIPPIAFVPLVILWFGLTEGGKYFLVFWGVFYRLDRHTSWRSTRRPDLHQSGSLSRHPRA